MATRPSGWQRYTPLAGAGVTLFLAIAVLPSALTQPQTNPTRTLEFAPVPESDENTTPPGGNVSALGLGSSGTLTALDRPTPTPSPPRRIDAVGKNPQTKRCIGDPPRQTGDPLSPPCVAFFKGDNFGATYRGVTAGEVRVIFHFNGNSVGGPTSRGTEQSPTDAYYDVDAPARDDDPYQVRALRVLQRYFNDRFQTYDRHVHFHVYYDRGAASAGGPAAGMRADAADNVAEIDPFASVVYSPFGYEADYLQAMAQQGVLAFASRSGMEAGFFRRYPKLTWGYYPSVENEARAFIDLVCTRVVDRPASFSGNAEKGQPRRLGFIRTTDAGNPGMVRFGELARAGILGCGARFEAEAAVPVAGRTLADTSPDYAYTNMATFKQNQVTTVIWAQGEETNQSAAAAQLDYHPEWIVAGDRFFEGADRGSGQDRTVWDRAWTVSPVVRVPPYDQTFCVQALREADPAFPRTDAVTMCTTFAIYETLRQLFTGIQVAGPRLNPDQVDKGFRAIPAVRSSDPRIPACFYEPDDSTCVKDAQLSWWDPDGRTPNARTNGCWRMPEDGRRYLHGTWPSENVDSRKNPTDPCNGFLAFGLFAA